MVEAAEPQFKEYAIEEFLVRSEPYYRPVGDEMDMFQAAYQQHIPVLLKGPTGCGKTRFVEYMAWKLGRPLTVVKENANARTHVTSNFIPTKPTNLCFGVKTTMRNRRSQNFA